MAVLVTRFLFGLGAEYQLASFIVYKRRKE
jgi:hypothetical protein